VDRHELDELTGIMARLAAGDETAVVALYERFGTRVAGTVRAVLRARGLSLVHDEVDGLVHDACFAIARVAGAWSPHGGALPWTWARRRIESSVDRLLGPHTVPLDDHLRTLDDRAAAGTGGWSAWPPGGSVGHGDRPVGDTFAELIATDARCRLLDRAFDRASLSPLDRELCLQYAVEQRTGNRSPATTVGVMFRLRPPAVRQRVRRSRQRLRRLAASDARFEPIARMPLVGG
jgi:DNA-directed RNA polymerase specialized sigma24 family protein